MGLPRQFAVQAARVTAGSEGGEDCTISAVLLGKVPYRTGIDTPAA